MTQAAIFQLLESVTDPEIPVLTIADLGIIRSVNVSETGVQIVITPTYSGCPAMNEIEKNIREMLDNHGVKNVTVLSVLSPAWTTDWMTESGKKKLMAYPATNICFYNA